MSRLKLYFLISIRVIKFPPRLIWIGDSHAHYFANPTAPLRRVSISPENDMVIYLGPRLLYSVAKKGFQFDFLTRILLRLASRNHSVILVLGEIDCRVHLVSKTLPFGQKAFDEIASDYSVNVLEMARRFKFKVPILLGPVPPSELVANHSEYPFNGSLSERILVTAFLSNALMRESSLDLRYLDLSAILNDDRGALSSFLTDDGVHTNVQGSKLTREQILKLKLALPGTEETYLS